MGRAIEVRRAALDDWLDVAGLLAELGRPSVLSDPNEARHKEAFAAYLVRSDAFAWVAVIDGNVRGFCNMELRLRLNFLEPQAWIPDLVVSESARSAGAGAALLAEAESVAREQGCFSLSLESAAWRTRAHAFYRREGMNDAGLAFSKSLTGVVWPPQAPRSS
ncbi:MAG: hypothetical protein NVSMB57_08470 [Actinomycetota bacterium]